MFDLDNLKEYERCDSKGMGKAVAGMPSDVRQGVKKGRDFALPGDYRNIDKVLITGMGGSAMAGELLRILLAPEARLPVMVSRDYMVPSFVDAKTLVIASSFSGGTAETISAMEDAADRKARVLAFSRGGKIEEEAKKKGFPAFHIDYDGLPRAALGFTLSALITFMEQLGVIQDASKDFDDAVQVMQGWQREIEVSVPEADNEAKKLARRMLGKAIAIYGGDTLSGSARRWKQQINENSKHLAFHGEIPEMNHNMLLGLEFPLQTVGNLMWIILESDFDHEKNIRRIHATAEAGNKTGVTAEVVKARGATRLSQMFSSIHFGDYVSYYLGMLHETDPSDLSAVSVFKEEMQKP